MSGPRLIHPEDQTGDWLETTCMKDIPARQVAHLPAETPEPVPDAPLDGTTDEDQPPALSDEGIALRFVEKHGNRLRYVAAWSRWYAWTSELWEVDSTLGVFSLTRSVCRLVASEADKPNDKTRIASAATVAAVERLARSDRRVAATVDQWDLDPDVLNTKWGES